MSRIAKVTEKSDMEVLEPQPIVRLIGGKEFNQEPLTLSSMGTLTSLLFQVITIAAGSSALASLGSIDLSTDDGRAQAMPVLIQLLGLAPDVLPRIVAAILGTSDEDDITLIGQKTRPKMLMDIISDFIDQNEPEELFAAFLVLKERMMRTVTAIRK